MPVIPEPDRAVKVEQLQLDPAQIIDLDSDYDDREDEHQIPALEPEELDDDKLPEFEVQDFRKCRKVPNSAYKWGVSRVGDVGIFRSFVFPSSPKPRGESYKTLDTIFNTSFFAASFCHPPTLSYDLVCRWDGKGLEALPRFHELSHQPSCRHRGALTDGEGIERGYTNTEQIEHCWTELEPTLPMRCTKLHPRVLRAKL
ncbi:hypothetical protein DFH09DRAFT_1088474 [Mycena vulgaris]|nr:hypothetical protein DFH09DRAFT_1104312 [Mycena vulgaris]KAJ6544607.1 hypothetical protein DFH09DRAFT_1088474 [Mycena vulgaris]